MAAPSAVITGLGLIAAPGQGVQTVWEVIRSGVCALKPMSLFPSPRYGAVLAGEAPHDLTALGAPKRGSRSDKLGWLAAREAVDSAAWPAEFDRTRAGLVMGCSVGGSFDSERFLISLLKHGTMRAGPMRYHDCMSVVDLIAQEFDLLGPTLAVSTACSSGAQAIATAAEMIQSGEADIMLAGGVDSLSRMTWGGFSSLLLIDAAGCRPFDAARAGTTMGEGAAMLVLESEDFARRRGATILARVSGWGASCDAHHATAPHPEGAGAIAAMQNALDRASLAPTEIDYVNSHGTGTRENDLAEAKALRAVFNPAVPPFSSTKRFFGHALAASGAIEAILCVQALRRQEMPPNPGFSTMDPAIGLAPIVKMNAAPLRHVMSNSFGFGGNNSVLIFSRPDAPCQTKGGPDCAIAVTGMGLVPPGPARPYALETPLPVATVMAHGGDVLPDTDLLNPNQRRRLCRMTQMALISSLRCPIPSHPGRLAVIMGTGLGCVEEGAIFLENMISKDENSPMPARFPGSVHNAPAAQIAMSQNARGLNSAPTASEVSFEAALWLGLRQLACDQADTVLAGAVDELNKYPLSIGHRWKLWNDTTIPGEGAMMAALTLPQAGIKPLARVTKVRLGRQQLPFAAEAEAEWLAALPDLAQIDIVLTGAGGWAALEEPYQTVVAALSRRLGRKIEHRTYKQQCGEFNSASAFGFAEAVRLVESTGRGVLLYTLALRGSKAACCVMP